MTIEEVVKFIGRVSRDLEMVRNEIAYTEDDIDDDDIYDSLVSSRDNVEDALIELSKIASSLENRDEDEYII